jgi:FAD/FMN-containing dehydrogenase
VTLPGGFVERLREVVGRHVLTDPDIVTSYTTDWTGRFVGRSPAVVRPGSTEEVAGVVALCRESAVALVPQGGNTGLVGGGVPLEGEIVVSLGRLDRVEPVDELAGQLTAGGGATIAALHRAAAGAGWSYGVDLGSRDSATVGGTVATNAGGLHVLRHGDTRAQVLGLEAVLGTGAVVSHLGGLVKDNTGYHWPGLLTGGEGTLGVVTAARLRLVPASPWRTTAILAFAAVADALEAASLVRRSLPSLDACELFFEDGVALVCSVTGMPPPFAGPHPVCLLLEAADRTDPTGALAEVTASLPHVLDTVVATEPAPRAALWRYREGHTEAINSLGAPHKLDVTLPQRSLAAFIEQVRDAVADADPDAEVWLFGHVGDGNVHVNVTGVSPDDERVDEAVFGLVAGFGGSISAEHGIGTAKKRWLELARSSAEIEMFRALKSTFDPDGILNPNVLLPADDRC